MLKTHEVSRKLMSSFTKCIGPAHQEVMGVDEGKHRWASGQAWSPSLYLPLGSIPHVYFYLRVGNKNTCLLTSHRFSEDGNDDSFLTAVQTI